MLTAAEVPHCDEFQDIIWNKKIPLEVSIFAWRHFRNHIATKDNLVTRKILQPHLNVCISDCNHEETIHHLFLSCNYFGNI